MAMLFVAGLIGRSASFWRAGVARDIPTVEGLLSLSDWFERTLVIPTYFSLLATGLVTAWITGWPVLGAVRGDAPKWALVSLTLFLTPMLVIPTYLVPRRKERTRALADAVSRGAVTPALAAALHDRGVVFYRRAEMVVTAVVIVLMVTKPF
jgi:hypothetical protein